MNLRNDNTPHRGDVVTMKSIPGPRMLVLADEEDGEVSVTWFDTNHVLHEAKFGLDVIEKDKLPTIDFKAIQVPYGTENRLKEVVKMSSFAEAMAKNQKIQAIKYVREYTGLGLKEAKDFVESPEIADRRW